MPLLDPMVVMQVGFDYMNIIFLSDTHSTSKHIRLQASVIVFVGLAVLAIPFITSFTAYWVGYSKSDDNINQQKISGYAAELAEQKELVNQARESAEYKIKAVSLRLAQMQAQLVRLDALGERLTEVAKLRSDEFIFSQVPAVGGPLGADLGDAFQPPEFLAELDRIAEDIEKREEQLSVLESLLEGKKLVKDVFIAGRPIGRGWMSSRYGHRTDPFNGRLAWHKGVDFAGKEDSDVISVAAGVVTWSSDRYGYGQMVEVNHGGGFVTRYAHNKENLVKVGDIVKKGQVLAKMGSTGRSTGPHVHFEVIKNGSHVNPTRYIDRASL
ncbi:MAG: M23 family metallopeptidase [Pseudomonadales bacterium]|nr:M23 family metallopeptidase [Pseudomonadales bacterium]